jgi:hypothetical protein
MRGAREFDERRLDRRQHARDGGLQALRDPGGLGRRGLPARGVRRRKNAAVSACAASGTASAALSSGGMTATSGGAASSIGDAGIGGGPSSGIGWRRRVQFQRRMRSRSVADEMPCSAQMSSTGVSLCS